MTPFSKSDECENLVLKISYDGTNYLGWQKTPIGPTIESTIEEALAKILGWTPQLQAASRTDRGVHAHSQIINFYAKVPLPLTDIKEALNQLLPDTISVHDLMKAPIDFHPSVDSLAKEYHYFVATDQILSPFSINHSWHYPFPLDIDKMRQAASELIGCHNFKAFSNVQPREREETHREVYKVAIIEEKFLRFEIKANRFLYKMARNIVGTLIQIGCGKIQTPIKILLASGDRKLMGMTAPAQGLFLHSIDYPQK